MWRFEHLGAKSAVMICNPAQSSIFKLLSTKKGVTMSLFKDTSLLGSAFRFLLASIFTAGFVSVVPSVSHAEDGRTRTQTTTITTSERDELSTPTPTPTPGQQDYLVEKVFGSKAQSGLDGCKTDDLVEIAKAKLEKQCRAWMKERKEELGSKYQAGTCNDDCEECGTSLKRCHVKGVVHYSK